MTTSPHFVEHRIDPTVWRPATLDNAETKNDFETAVGEAAQDAVWATQHPLTHHMAEDDPRREKYLREYQQSVGHQLLAAIGNLRPGVRFYCLEMSDDAGGTALPKPKR